jgi:predicted transcriptional regulator
MKSLKVKEYMSTRLITFKADTNVVNAMTVLLENSISGAPVVDDDGNLVGVLSEVDIMQVIVQDSYYDESMGIVGDFMHAEVDVVDPEMDIYTLAQRFISEGRRRFPVVSRGRLVGQISRRDVLRAADASLHHKS